MQLYDIIIAGGGVSGICAAVAAARSGASALVLRDMDIGACVVDAGY